MCVCMCVYVFGEGAGETGRGNKVFLPLYDSLREFSRTMNLHRKL